MGNLNDRARPPARSPGVRACPLARAARPISRIVVAPLLLFLLLVVLPRPSSSSSSCRAAPTTTVVTQHAGRQAGRQHDGEAGRWRFAKISLSETNDQRPKGAFAGSSTDRQDKPVGRAALQRADHHPGCKGRVYGLGVDEEEVASVDGGDRAGRPAVDRQREKKKRRPSAQAPPPRSSFSGWANQQAQLSASFVNAHLPTCLPPALPFLPLTSYVAPLSSAVVAPGRAPLPPRPACESRGKLRVHDTNGREKRWMMVTLVGPPPTQVAVACLLASCCCCSSPVPLSSSFSSPHLASPRAERSSLISSTSNLRTRSRLVSRPRLPTFWERTQGVLPYR